MPHIDDASQRWTKSDEYLSSSLLFWRDKNIENIKSNEKDSTYYEGF